MSADASLQSTDLGSDHESPFGTSSGMGSLHEHSSPADPESSFYMDVLPGHSPPKLTQFSSVLDLRDKSVVRPIAYKPLLTNKIKFLHRHHNSASTSPTLASLISQPISHQYSSYIDELDDHHSLTYSVDSCLKITQSPNSCISVSSVPKDFERTPSPSDSGVAELEAMLQEKSAEITYLRETLEKNEQVIFKVYEEKEQRWTTEVKRLQTLYENKLKNCLHRLAKAERTVSRQTYQLQEEKKKVQMHTEVAEKQTVENERLCQEVETLQSQLQEKESTLCQMEDQITVLNSRLKEQSFYDSTGSLFRKQMHIRHDPLLVELSNTKQELEMTQQHIRQERTQWAEEKEKVIRYQKQLHTNYMQVYRKNRHLETQLQELTAALQHGQIQSSGRNSSVC